MNLDFLKGTAIFGVLVGFWDKIKAFLWKFISIVIQRVEISTEEAHDAVIAYLATNFKRVNSYDKNYGASYETMRNGKYGLVAYEKFGASSILFKSNKKSLGFIRFLFLFSNSKDNEEGNHGSYHYSSNKTYSTITCIRGTLNIDEIIKQATATRNNNSWRLNEKEANFNRFDIFYLPNKSNDRHANIYNESTGFAWYNQNQYRLLGVKPEDIGRAISSNGKALDNLFFPKEIKNLIHVISLWVKSKNWYNEKNIPWKRGWLLYGPPGTGKTALVRAFAEDLNMPIYVFSLSQMSNNDLATAWKTMQLNIPCIALIEDIDNVFNGRKNVSMGNNMLNRLLTNDNQEGSSPENSENKESTSFSPLTFDCLLNCLDGVDKSEGVFTIITTNDISKIDPAIGHPKRNEDGTTDFISTRPGRIDRAIELTHMDKDNKIEMAIKIVGDFPDQLKNVLIHIDKEIVETPAQFQEYCAQLAIQEYWKLMEKSNKIGSDLMSIAS